MVETADWKPAAERNARMLREQIIARGIRDPRVLAAFRATPRELFVPEELAAEAYGDYPLSIGRGQTISQPYIVAMMSELLELGGDETVLEVGTGSGYQTAILARLARHVCSAELEAELLDGARRRFERLRIDNVELAVGDATRVFAHRAPFDAILSAAAPEEMPEHLFAQLAEGGRCVIPVGPSDWQYLWRVTRRGGELHRERLEAVRFVPLR